MSPLLLHVKCPTRRGGVIPLSCKPPLHSLPPSLSRLPSPSRWPQRLAPAAARMCSCGLSQRLSEAPFVVPNERHSSDLSLSTSSCSLHLIFCLLANKRGNKERNTGGENDLSLLVSRLWKKNIFWCKSRGDFKPWVRFYIQKRSESKNYFFIWWNQLKGNMNLV